MKRLLWLLMPIMALSRAFGQISHPLFVLERDQNANRLHYEVVAGGEFPSPATIKVYWTMHEKDGRIEELTTLERKKAYGIDIKARRPGEIEFIIKALPSYPVTVHLNEADMKPVATMRLAHEDVIVERIFLNMSGFGPIRSVTRIDIYCRNRNDGSPLKAVIERDGNRWKERIERRHQGGAHAKPSR